ncbi:hypothetical protein DFA_00813 [Cavenderia fasciculata]|uniref:Carbohydrate binding domain-containing protein n=1 Tax=Cavenderia fasciculata TaxID=261658 RepID=F4PTW5_CACFS|nr:uncharacterized protein DFA_00813 [Cavenderia fasciculata]EGG20944.1 hypothetical protein DFA_00813 [Cavenderia fasciculata]|eukprot:XP_004358794.1 hypothetical protein DFA_00813 [Cavenderia fasciculata]
MKLLLSLVILFLVGLINCQPETFQFFSQIKEETYYGVYSLSNGNITLSTTNAAPDLQVLGFLPKNGSSNDIMTVCQNPSNLQINTYSTSDNSFTTELTFSPNYKYNFVKQEYVFDSAYRILYIPGSVPLNGENYLALLQWRFGPSVRPLVFAKENILKSTYLYLYLYLFRPPIILGQGYIPNSNVPINPVGAYDAPNQDYYIYYTIGTSAAILKFNFVLDNYAILPLDIEPTPLNGVEQIFFYQGQLIYCRIDKGVGVTIAQIELSGPVTNVYKDTDTDKQFNIDIQPFVFDQTTGTITILNSADDTLYLDVFYITTLKVTSFTNPNSIPSGTFVITALYN